MFKSLAIKKYGTKLYPQLIKSFGEQSFYTASQVRATVYKHSFNPYFLPLGYILFLDCQALSYVLHVEYPQLCLKSYKKEMSRYLHPHDVYNVPQTSS